LDGFLKTKEEYITAKPALYDSSLARCIQTSVLLQNTKKAENKESEGVYGMSSILGTLGWYENNG
jgi:hypothetical protein